MYPVLFSFGPIHIFSFSIFLILAWGVFSFLFWKLLRAAGTVEERIFDLTFYATLAAIVGGRLGFVLTHLELFADGVLKTVALWIAPGLSVYGALFSAMLTLVYLARRYKMRLGLVLDALALSLPVTFLVGTLGAFLDGSYVGKISSLPWAIRYVGNVGKRHPLQLYEMIAIFMIIVIILILQKRSVKNKWPYGLLGVWFFLIWSVSEFALEFLKDTSVYWMSLSANQWVLIVIFGEALGAFYVRGGLRETIRPMFTSLRTKLAATAGGIYAKFSQRRSG